MLQGLPILLGTSQPVSTAGSLTETAAPDAVEIRATPVLALLLCARASPLRSVSLSCYFSLSFASVPSPSLCHPCRTQLLSPPLLPAPTSPQSRSLGRKSSLLTALTASKKFLTPAVVPFVGQLG